MAEALYRKYRPQVFEDVVGQEPIERTLKNAIAQDKVSHAYLFCGPRGTGKTTTARLLAKALLCEGGPTPEPDGTCEDCQLIAEGTHPDVYELDAASRTGVENVREEIISRVQFAPTRGRFKIYIIDEVHMLSTAAFNALLKTLEEPPSHVVFILCTTDPQKVPETIHSRCQRFDFRRIAPESMVLRLGAICMAEGVEFEGEALDLIAQRAEGGLRNALTSLEQIIAFENGRVSLEGAERLLGSIDSTDLAEIMGHVGRRDIASCFRWTAAYVETGADLAQFVRDMSEHVRNLYVMALVGDDADLDVTETARRQLASELQWFGPDRASRLLGVLGDLSAELKTASNPRLSFEISLTRMVRPDSDLTIESLAERVEALESGYSAVAHVVGGGPVARDAADSVAAQAVAPVREAAEGMHAEASQPSPRSSASFSVAAGAVSVEAAAEVGVVAAGAAGAAESLGGADAQTAEETRVQPEAQVVAGSAPDYSNPATLQRVWQATLSEVKRQKQAHGVLFMNTKARYDAEAGKLVVVFPAESAFAFNTVQKPDVRATLAAALRHTVGADVPYAYEQAGSASADATPAGTAPAVAAPAVATPAGTAPAVAAPAVATPAGSAPAGTAPASAAPAGSASASAAPAVEADTARSDDTSPSYDEVPYEQVPYEELGYDSAPYEQPSSQRPSPAPSPEPSPAPSSAAQSETPQSESAAPGASDASDIEAMLQAGFGNGVVLQEINE